MKNQQIGLYADRDQLIAALQRVPDDSALVKNQVGNLSIVRLADAAYIGWIEINDGECKIINELDIGED